MFNSFFGGAALIGLLAGCWSYVKMLFWRIASLAIVRVRIEGYTSEAVSALCWSKFSRSPFGERRYGGFHCFVRPEGRNLTVGCEHVSNDPMVCWRGWRPMLISFNSGNGPSDNLPSRVILTYVRGTFDSDALVIEAVNMLNARRHDGDSDSRYRVYKWSGSGSRKGIFAGGNGDNPTKFASLSRANEPIPMDSRVLRWEREDLGVDDGGDDPFAGLAYPAEVLDVVNDLRFWKASEDWYKSKLIPWRYGVLFYGIPGTGKSRLARAVAQDLDMPIICLNLASYNNQEFQEAWANLMEHTPCMVLLEDIDAVFSGRENKLGDNGGGLTFDCLLNCISGVEAADGICVVVTTNKVHELDEALGKPSGKGTISTRPGRIDRVVELGPMDENCRRQIAEKILSDYPEEIEAQVAACDGYTGAQFVYHCGEIARARHWSCSQRNGHQGNLVLANGYRHED